MTTQNRLRATWLCLVCLGVIGVVLYLASLGGENVVPWTDHYEVRAVVPTADNLDVYSEVREGGVLIGRVTSLAPGPDFGSSTVLTLRIDSRYAPIYRDATLMIRDKSVAEEKYVQLQPGHRRAGAIPNGGTLPKGRALTPTEFDDVMSILNGARRSELRQALGGLGPGLAGGMDLNRTLGSSAALTEDATPLAAILSQDRAHVASLLDSFDKVSQELGTRYAAIRTLTVQAAATARAVAARDQDLRATLDVLPAFLSQARQTANRLTSFSLDATPVVSDLATASEQLVPAVRALGPGAAAGRQAVMQLQRFAKAGLPVMRLLRPFSRVGSRFVPSLAGLVRQVNPLLAYLNPYAPELGSWFSLERAATQVADDIGHVVRPTVPISRSNFYGSVEPILSKLMSNLDTRGSNPYPVPGGAGDPTAFTGSYRRLNPDPPYSR